MIPKNNEVRFEISTKCNYHCVICARDRLRRKHEIMPTEKFKFYLEKVLSQSDQYDTLTFSGFGESLLDKDFTGKLKLAGAFGLKTLLLTNASLLPKELFKELEDIGLESIRVSFYGVTPESYNKMHGIKGNNFTKVRENLTGICKRDRRTKILMTYNVLDGINSDDVEEWIKYWEPITDLVEVWRPHNWVYGRNYRQIQAKRTKTCGRPWNTPLQIQVDGTVNMCCFDFNGDLLLGDLNDQNLEEVFDSRMFKAILECHTTGNYEGSDLICKNCDQRNADKSDTLLYSSKFDIEDRVNRVSTTYTKVT